MLATVEKNELITIPFLKWAGGKRWLTTKFPHLFPEEYETYIEPFLGSGAVFFHLNPSKAILGDLNEDLVNVYSSIKYNWFELSILLRNFHDNHSKNFYYSIRKKQFNTSVEKAAQFLYLNRTCWNGLYRVNLKGEFNVPIGTKTKVIMDTDNFEKISNLLNTVELISSDFSKLIDSAQKDDFLFIDPPYCIDLGTGFTKYNKTVFQWSDQIRLCEHLIKASSRGAKFLLTNVAHPSTESLFKDLGEVIRTERASVISGDNSGRGRYQEIIVRNY